MGSGATKSKLTTEKQQQSKNDTSSKKWKELKERQITLPERDELCKKLNDSLENIDQAIVFLETRGIIVERGLLGTGGCGFVLKACSLEDDHLAVKFMRAKIGEQFDENNNEYDILKQLNSPYIIKVMKSIVAEFQSTQYQITVMERGIYDLKKYILKKINTSQSIPQKSIFNICLELAKGLQVLHSHNILHLDIKPANILFGYDLKWKFADLGISKVLNDEKQHTQNLAGLTVNYSSPEQYQLLTHNKKKKITKASDVYSLGVVFLELTGVDITSKRILKEKLSQGNFEKSLNPSFEELNERLIKKMMVYKPSERLEIDEVVVALKELCKRKSIESNDKLYNTHPIKRKPKNSLNEDLEQIYKREQKRFELTSSEQLAEIEQNQYQKPQILQKLNLKLNFKPTSVNNMFNELDDRDNHAVPHSDRDFNQYYSPIVKIQRKSLQTPIFTSSFQSSMSNALSTKESKLNQQNSFNQLPDQEPLRSANKRSTNLPSINEFSSPTKFNKGNLNSSQRLEMKLPRIHTNQNLQQVSSEKKFVKLHRQQSYQNQIFSQLYQQQKLQEQQQLYQSSRSYFESPNDQRNKDFFRNNNYDSSSYLPAI